MSKRSDTHDPAEPTGPLPGAEIPGQSQYSLQ